MTDELLGKIFYHLCESGPLSLRHLLFVSRRFYSATVNNARLWTTISLDSSFFHYFHQRPEHGNKFVEHSLLHSGLLPLCLYIDHSGISSHDVTFLLPFLETFGKPEWNGFQRCTSLIWKATRDEATTIKMFLDLLPKSLPSLKHFSFTGFFDPIGESQFPNCPVLESMEMLHHLRPFFDTTCSTMRHCMSSPQFWGTNFLHVTALSFGNHYDWPNFDLTALSLFPVLQDLTLFTLCGIHDIRVGHRILPVTLGNLHILRAHGRIPHAYLTMLVAPNLEELYLEANSYDYTSIHELQTSFKPLCRDIHALLPKAVSAIEPEWATKLSKLVRNCVMIESLYISRWMEEECKISLSGQNVVLHVQ